MNRHPDNEGFALISVIFALLIISVMATGGLYTAHQDSLIAEAEKNADEALYIAENGVAAVLADWDPLVMDSLEYWEADTLTGSLTDEGEWKVKVLRVNDRMFYLEGEGQIYRNGQLASNVSRTVGISTARPNLKLEPPAALTTRGPTVIKGNAEVHGEDETPPGWTGICDPATDHKPGIVTDDEDGVGTTGAGEITGSPTAVEEDSTISDATFQDFGDMDWEALTELATIKLPSDVTINQTFPDSTMAGVCIEGSDTNWGNPVNPAGACGHFYPIIHAPGDLRVQSGGIGQGILLVDGTLDLRGGFLFHGIVIVQGAFETQGSGNRVRGAVMAGNADFDDQSLTGGSVVGYSSCSVLRAIEMNAEVQRPRILADRAWSDLSRSGSQ